jgi:uncharacterized protein (DUF488 family)
MVLFTIGHSTRSLDELVEALRGHGVVTLCDVRTVPRSRHNPQFNREALEAQLPSRGIAYRHLPQLGGLRRPRKDSPNGAWRNASFRGFADYMQTDEFEAALDELMSIAAERGPAAVMCAEAVPWRCHRSLIADALTARGVLGPWPAARGGSPPLIEVRHIRDARHAEPHRLTAFARVREGRVSYPPLV